VAVITNATPARSSLSAPISFYRGRQALLPTLQAFGGFRSGLNARTTGFETLGRIGSLEVRLATRAADIRRAQRLRYRVFYEELSAVADRKTMFARRDIDIFDSLCDHLLVHDHSIQSQVSRKPLVVGTYRLLRQEVAARRGGFYSAGEFDIEPLLARHRGARFLELGRSCVLAPYRTKRTVELLWQGIWAYVQRHQCDVLIGCASLQGTDPDQLALPLSFLHHYAPADPSWQVQALPHRHVAMNRLPKAMVDTKLALKALPPLLKGYLRVGARVAEGAVIDHQFGTTDVLVILPVVAIKSRYIEYFGAGAEPQAA
jgi:putative hemolysin